MSATQLIITQEDVAMSTKALPCSCCGYLLTIPEDAPAFPCPACGTLNARPRSTGDTLTTLERATRQRLACDFAAAEASYQQVLLVNPDEHEALWGRLMCHYGVEYVEDPASGRRLPTVHCVQRKPLQVQADFIAACEYAPPSVRAQYQREAAYIDDVQADIRRLAESCEPYDVFLCHKTTKPGTDEKTEDFYYATQLYHYLKDHGVRVFFAPECLHSVAGANYEAGIYHALETSRVMLVVCANEEHLTSAWVRSEWSRFMEMMDEDEDRRLVPLLYNHFHFSQLPQHFRIRKLQSMDMTDISASQNLLKLLTPSQPQTDPDQPEPAPGSTDKPAFSMDDVKKVTKGLADKAGKGLQMLKGKPRKAKAPVRKKPKQKATARQSSRGQSEPELVPLVDTAPADARYAVGFTFPGLREHWKKVPNWVVLAADRKTELTGVKWNTSATIPLETNHTKVWFAEKKRKRNFWYLLLMLAFLFVAFVFWTRASEDRELLGINDAAVVAANVNGCAALVNSLLAVGYLLAFLLKSAPYRIYGSLVIFTHKHYHLSWHRGKWNKRFRAQEKAVDWVGLPPAPEQETQPADFPADMQHPIHLTFPPLRKHWKDVPDLVILAEDKKTRLAEGSWNTSIAVSLLAEHTLIWFAGKGRRYRPVFLLLTALSLLLLFFSCFMYLDYWWPNSIQPSFYGEPYCSFPGIGVTIFTGLCAVVFALLYKYGTPRRYYGKLIVGARKRYRLSWPRNKMKEKFLAKEE